MRKSHLPLLVLVISSLLLSACARDEEVVSKEKRAEIAAKSRGAPRGQTSSRPGSNANSPQVKLGTFGLAAFLVDKHAEALELVLASDLGVSQKTGEVRVDFSTDDTQSNVAKSLVADKRVELHSLYSQNRYALWDAQSFTKQTDAGKELSLFIASTDTSKVTLDLIKKAKDSKDRLFVNYFENEAQIRAKRLNDKGEYEIKMRSNGELVVGKDGVIEKTPYRLSLLLVANLSDKKAAQVQVLRSRADFVLQRANRELKAEVSSRESLTFSNTQCPVMLGSAQLVEGSAGASNSKPVSPKTLVFEEDKVMMKGLAWQAPVAPCNARPIVDYSKILVY